jgi:hypothetical protein
MHAHTSTYILSLSHTYHTHTYTHTHTLSLSLSHTYICTYMRQEYDDLQNMVFISMSDHGEGGEEKEFIRNETSFTAGPRGNENSINNSAGGGGGNGVGRGKEEAGAGGGEGGDGGRGDCAKALSGQEWGTEDEWGREEEEEDTHSCDEIEWQCRVCGKTPFVWRS